VSLAQALPNSSGNLTSLDLCIVLRKSVDAFFARQLTHLHQLIVFNIHLSPCTFPRLHLHKWAKKYGTRVRCCCMLRLYMAFVALCRILKRSTSPNSPFACSADKYKKSQRSAAGADKWLDVRVSETPQACLDPLKEAGYQVVVTHLSSNSISIQVRRTGPATI
jgi:hypothetical protein